MAMQFGTAPWDLHRRGLQDARRHDERVREALRKRLPELITEEAIISSDGSRKIRMPIRYLDLYRFRYADEENPQGVGSGDAQKGDVVARRDGRENGAQPGDLPGDQPGESVYETEFSVDDLARMMMEDMHLPWLEDRDAYHEETRTDTIRDVRRRGLWKNLDRRRTLYENIKRQAARGGRKEPGLGAFVDDDLRFRAWREEYERRTRAAVYMLMDRSGSMSTEKRYIAKCFYFWLVHFLRTRYQELELVFITHDTRADLVEEDAFFTISSSGGTHCSSAYSLALEHIEQHHPAASWNNYVFHFSDGDNFPSDNPRVVATVEELLRHTRMVGCGEIIYHSWSSFQAGSRTTGQRRQSSLFQVLDSIKEQRLVTTTITSRDQVYSALKVFLQGEREEIA